MKIIKTIKDRLGITDLEERMQTLEELLYDERAKSQGFAVLKKHLRTKNEKFLWMGEEI